MIDTQHLYYLVTVAKTESLSKASHELFISQQAIGKAMRKIEDELQVSLFERTKNKIVLNEYGQMAVKYAENILLQLDNMENAIRLFERQNRMMVIGSCAPRILAKIYDLTLTFYQDISITTQIAQNNDLIKGLYDRSYQLVILPYKIENENVYFKKCGKERLYFSLPSNHRLANKKSLSYKDLDGETLLLYKNIGVWDKIAKEEMPNTKFIIEDNRESFKELSLRSNFVTFATDLSIEKEGIATNRIVLPIVNDKATLSFYCLCLKENKEKYKDLFNHL